MSVLVGHDYLPHAGSGWKRQHSLKCQIYMILHEAERKNAVAHSYWESLRRKDEGASVASNVLSSLESDGGGSHKGDDCGSHSKGPENSIVGVMKRAVQ